MKCAIVTVFLTNVLASTETNWRSFVQEEVTGMKDMFDDLNDLDAYMTAISRRNRQYPNLVPGIGILN